jgi:hypothetical protein
MEKNPMTKVNIAMKLPFANLSAAKICTILVLVVLTGCTVAPWERDFWHPPAATGIAPITGDAPHPTIKRLDGSSSQWRELGEVPERPVPPNTIEEQAQALAILAAERDAALTVRDSAPAAEPTGQPLSADKIIVPEDKDAPQVPPEVQLSDDPQGSAP